MNMQNDQTMNPAKNTQTFSQKIKLVSLIAAGLAILLTITWFLPIVTRYGHSYSYLDMLGGHAAIRIQNSAQEVLAFWFFVMLSVATIFWSVLPKKWAAVTGLVCSAVQVCVCLMVVSNFSSQKLTLAFGGILMILLSVLILAMSIAKLALIRKEGKQNVTIPRAAHAVNRFDHDFSAQPQASATQSGFSFCPNCGTKLMKETIFCPNCGRMHDNKD